MSLRFLRRHFTLFSTSTHSDRPVVNCIWNDSTKQYGFHLHDLGCVDESIEVWAKNEDVDNGATLYVGIVYDVIKK